MPGGGVLAACGGFAVSRMDLLSLACKALLGYFMPEMCYAILFRLLVKSFRYSEDFKEPATVTIIIVKRLVKSIHPGAMRR